MQQGKWHYLHDLTTAYEHKLELEFSHFNREIWLLIKCKQPMTARLLLKFSLGVKKAIIKSQTHMSPPQDIDPNPYPVSRSSLCESPFAAKNSTCQGTERMILISDDSYLLSLFCCFSSHNNNNNNYSSQTRERCEKSPLPVYYAAVSHRAAEVPGRADARPRGWKVPKQ